MTDAVEKGVLAGRRFPAYLTDEGVKQAKLLSKLMSAVQLAAIYTSPLQRSRVTADAISKERTFVPVVEEAFDEIDIGEWTGKEIAELKQEPLWIAFNKFRSGTRPPGGETMLEVQQRAVAAIQRLREEHQGERIAIISHSDVIKTVVGHFAGISIDLISRIEIEPASVSVIEIGNDFVSIKAMNVTENLGGVL
jgi:broad specificity phosphatase PhoE